MKAADGDISCFLHARHLPTVSVSNFTYRKGPAKMNFYVPSGNENVMFDLSWPDLAIDVLLGVPSFPTPRYICMERKTTENV